MLPTSVRFADLKARKIVDSWQQLGYLINTQGFPLGRYIGLRTRVWTEDEVAEWLANRPAGRPVIKDHRVEAA